MEKKKVLFIINPVSGITKHKFWVDLAIKALHEIYDFQVCHTKYAGHGNVLAKEAVAAGTDIVVAVGGDGTVNEVASALVGTSTRLSIFPMGSGNGLARELGINTKLSHKSIVALKHDQPKKVDYGLAMGQPFFCTCGTGFDAEIARRIAGSKVRGFISYAYLCAKALFTYKPVTVTYSVEGGETVTRPVFVINAANIKQFGFGAQIAPLASVQDGLLDVTIVPPINFLQAMKLAIGMFTHTFHKMSPVETFKCTELTVTLPDDAPFHIDGDYIKRTENTFTIKVIPGGINILV